MGKKIIHFRIDNDLAETSEKLMNTALSDEDLAFFKLQTSSNNTWHQFVYQMGLIKTKEQFEMFKQNLTGKKNAIENSNNPKSPKKA